MQLIYIENKRNIKMNYIKDDGLADILVKCKVR